MIAKPTGYDESATLGTGEYENLTIGGHICIIKAAREDSHNGKRYIVLAYDIAPDDPQGGYFERLYNRRMGNTQKPGIDASVRWPGTYWQGLDGKSTPFFKGMISSIEKSNPGYTWNWDEKTLKNKRFGGVFGREQFVGADGQLHWNTKCLYIRSTDGIADVEPPKDRPIMGAASGQGAGAIPTGYTEVEDNELPF